jgi:hypothetical protein
LGFTFTFYGTTYSGIFLNTNGGFTFAAGNDDFNPAATDISQPGVAVFWGDMSAKEGRAAVRPNQMIIEQFPNRFVIKYNQFQDRDNELWNNTATVTLFANGAIFIEYGGVLSEDILVGVFDGSHTNDQNLPVQTSFPDYEAMGTGIILFDHHGSGPTHNGQLSSQTIVFGELPLTTVTQLNSVAETGDGQLTDGEGVTVEITQLLVTFSGPVMDLAGDSDPDDVTNPANYRLLSDGTNDTFQTNACGLAQGDDTTLNINSVVYDAVTQTATVGVNGGVPLPPDAYRFMVCGSNSIRGENGFALDGDNDAVFGGDFVLDFIVGGESFIQFDSPSYTVSEDGDNATITVTRTGDSFGSVSVDYATSSGTAAEGSDYMMVSGTLTWGDGDSDPKTFGVPILEDSLVEGSETVNLALTNLTSGASLGTPDTATLNITDNDVAAALQVVPNTLSVASGSTDNSTISGGQSPYTASSSDNTIATASISGNTLNVTGVNPGTATITVMDDLGVSVGVSVTVSAGDPLSVSSSSLTTAVGETGNVTISGGQSPYTASSSDPGVATTSVSGNTVSITGVNTGSATVTVNDTGTESASIAVTVTSGDGTAPSVGGCAAGPNVAETIDTSIFDEFTLLLCQQPPVATEGSLYVAIEAPTLLPGLMFFRPGPQQVPLSNGSFIALVKDASGFFPGAEDFHFSQGMLSTSAGDLSFEVGTTGLNGLTLVFTTFYLPEGEPLNETSLQTIQVVTVVFN